jgi:hypothetical protein
MPITLEKIMKDLNGIEYELKMFVYHKINKRNEEAQTYLDAYTYASELMVAEMNGDCEIYIPKPDEPFTGVSCCDANDEHFIDDSSYKVNDVKELMDETFYDVIPIPHIPKVKRQTTNYRLTHPERNEIIE